MLGIQELARRLRSAGTPEEFVEIVRSGDVDFVDIRFADLPGGWHHVTLPVSRVAPSLFSDGIGFDGSSVPGFTTVERGDMVLLPDRRTATGERYGDHGTVAMVAMAADAAERTAYALDPRIIAQRAEEALVASGHADRSLWSPELEFYLFDGVDYGDEPNGSWYGIISAEAGWRGQESGTSDLGYRIRPRSGYHAVPPADSHFATRGQIVARMEEMGIGVKYHHHENGAPGQMEIELEPAPLVQSADSVIWSKHIVRNIASGKGLAATFMPKPLPWESGSGLHFHVKLFKGEVPIFHGDSGYAGLSSEALWFIGGVLSHGRALAAITNPSTNSYRRLRAGFEAPTNLFFSAANRSAAIRIPRYATEPGAKTIEFRPPDATCNAYLAAAALLAAGLDGMNRRLDPDENGFGPLDRNIHELPPKERDSIVPLPCTLQEALEELRKDSAFLTESGVFPEDFVESWEDLKRAEIEEVASRPHPREYDLYFNC